MSFGGSSRSHRIQNPQQIPLFRIDGRETMTTLLQWADKETGDYTNQSASLVVRLKHQIFGSPECYGDESFLLQDGNDPYGLLGSATVNEAHKCLIDFLLEPARLQYRAFTLVDDGSEAHKPIVLTNPNDSYWQQFQRLQRAFEQHWAEVRRKGSRAPPL